MVVGQISDALPIPDFVRTRAADKTTAQTAAYSITAALLARNRSAGSQNLEIPSLNAALAWYWVDGLADHTGRTWPLIPATTI